MREKLMSWRYMLARECLQTCQDDVIIAAQFGCQRERAKKTSLLLFF